MFSKISFNYGKKNNTKEMLINQLKVKDTNQLNDKKSIKESVNLRNKIDENKIKNIPKILLEGDENVVNDFDSKTQLIETKITSINNLDNKIQSISKNIIEANEKLANNLYDNIIQETITTEIKRTDNYSVNYDINRIYKKGIKTLVHVYQTKYKNSNSSGLGDFIRGSYFILDFCYKHNLEAKIIFNSPIINYLKNKEYLNNFNTIEHVLMNVELFKNNNIIQCNVKDGFILDPTTYGKNIYTSFINYIVSISPIYNSNVFIYSNCVPIEVTEKNKECMRKILEPTDELKIIINESLQYLGLKPNDYSVIHVRTGDIHLINKDTSFDKKYLQKLIAEIRGYINSHDKYILIADDSNVKLILKNIFPQVNILLNKITHFGEGVNLEKESVKNTMVDFYLFSYAKNIFCFSSYTHGSGFSYWCAKTYNIPYTCRFIEQK